MLNYGLDLEVVQSLITYQFILKKDINNLIYHGLIISPDSEKLQDYIDGSSNIHSTVANSAIQKIKNLSEQHGQELNNRHIELEIRSYEDLPVIHGFLINDKYLYLGFTQIESGKLQGGQYPYFFMKYDRHSKLTMHCFSMFRSWFAKKWEAGKVQMANTGVAA